MLPNTRWQHPRWIHYILIIINVAPQSLIGTRMHTVHIHFMEVEQSILQLYTEWYNMTVKDYHWNSQNQQILTE